MIKWIIWRIWERTPEYKWQVDDSNNKQRLERCRHIASQKRSEVIKRREIAGKAINTKPDENVDFSPAFALSLQIYLMSENQEEQIKERGERRMNTMRKSEIWQSASPLDMRRTLGSLGDSGFAVMDGAPCFDPTIDSASDYQMSFLPIIRFISMGDKDCETA